MTIIGWQGRIARLCTRYKLINTHRHSHKELETYYIVQYCNTNLQPSRSTLEVVRSNYDRRIKPGESEDGDGAGFKEDDGAGDERSGHISRVFGYAGWLLSVDSPNK